MGGMLPLGSLEEEGFRLGVVDSSIHRAAWF